MPKAKNGIELSPEGKREKELVENAPSVRRQCAENIADEPRENNGGKLQRDGPGNRGFDDFSDFFRIIQERRPEVAFKHMTR